MLLQEEHKAEICCVGASSMHARECKPFTCTQWFFSGLPERSVQQDEEQEAASSSQMAPPLILVRTVNLRTIDVADLCVTGLTPLRHA